MIDQIRSSKPKILVIGDLMIDNYLWGGCERISPEAPVQIVNVSDETSVLGGAGNVVNNLKAFDADVSVLSVIGDCNISLELKNLLKKIGVQSNHLIIEKGRYTSKKTRLIASNQQVIRYDIESNHDISLKSQKLMLSKLSEMIEIFDLIILSDYGKGIFTEELTRNIIATAKKNNIRVIVDPKGSDYKKYRGAFLLTPNRKEASLATNIEIKDHNSLHSCLSRLKEICNLEISLITLSEEGIAFLGKDLRIHPTVAKEVFDVTGAGDTVISSLGFALANKVDIDDAVQFANLAAGVVVSKIGSSTASFEEIIDYESSLHLSECEEHIKTDNEIDQLVKELKLKNKKIVFTNGCFDILHIGHVKYLEKAKKLGDILIVGLNSDESIKSIKGVKRPINPLEDRACIVAALESVDYVVPFNEDTPYNLIKLITPDVLAKGADYANKEIVGSDIVDDVQLITFVDGKSTSNIIEKINEF